MEKKHQTLKELPVSERPYEKCEKNGTAMLSDAELLAVILRSGTKDQTAIDLATKVLSIDPFYEGILGICHTSREELQKIPGIGKVKAMQILCIAELSKRLASAKVEDKISFHSPASIADYYMERMRHLSREEMILIFFNGKNKVNSLTLEQIQKIYSGEITNWKEVGGDDEKIIPYQRPVNSGSQTGILSLVMKGKKLMNPVNNVIETMEGIIKAVANYKDGKGSIGYSYYYYATSMYDLTDTNKENSIKLMGVDGVVPSYETIKDDSYPIRTNYYIVLRKDGPEDSRARKFANDLLSTRGQNVCKEAGYVPVK